MAPIFDPDERTVKQRPVVRRHFDMSQLYALVLKGSKSEVVRISLKPD